MIVALLLAAAQPVTCQSADDCARKWGRAIQWVLDHNPRIAEQNDSRILNAPVSVTGEDLYQVTRIPTGADSAMIDIKVECANVFSCKWKQRKREFAIAVMGDK